jgi:hypothetical protein
MGGPNPPPWAPPWGVLQSRRAADLRNRLRNAVFHPLYMIPPPPPPPQVPGTLLAPTEPVRRLPKIVWRDAAGPQPEGGAPWRIASDPAPKRRRVAGRVWQAIGIGPQPEGASPWKIAAGGQPRRRGHAGLAQALPPEPPAPAGQPWRIILGGQPRRRGQVALPGVTAPQAAAPATPPLWWQLVGGLHPFRRGHAGQASSLPPEPSPIAGQPWRIAAGAQPRHRGRAAQAQALPPEPLIQVSSSQPHAVYVARRSRPGYVILPRFGTPAATINAPFVVPTRIARDPSPRRQRVAGSAPYPRFVLAEPPPVFKTPLHGLFAARAESRLRSHGGRLVLPTSYPAVIFGPVLEGYHVYANTGEGLPINYTTPMATLYSFGNTTWTSPPLTYPGDWWFGVRAFNQYGVEQNLDCVVEIILDQSGVDITNRPAPPTGLRALAAAAGAIRAEWFYPPTSSAKAPLGFYVYITPHVSAVLAPAGPISVARVQLNAGGVRWFGSPLGAPTSVLARSGRQSAQSGAVLWLPGTSSSIDYAAPAATVSFGSAIANTFGVTIPGFVNGQEYLVGVRAYNATAAEPNTAAVIVTADSVGPAAVTNLTITATSTA